MSLLLVGGPYICLSVKMSAWGNCWDHFISIIRGPLRFGSVSMFRICVYTHIINFFLPKGSFAIPDGHVNSLDL